MRNMLVRKHRQHSDYIATNWFMTCGHTKNAEAVKHGHADLSGGVFLLAFPPPRHECSSGRSGQSQSNSQLQSILWW